MQEPAYIVTASQLRQVATDAAKAVIQQFNSTPDVMTKEQLAAYWQVSQGTINRYMAIGLPFKKIEAGSPRFYRKECDAWYINAGTKSP